MKWGKLFEWNGNKLNVNEMTPTMSFEITSTFILVEVPSTSTKANDGHWPLPLVLSIGQRMPLKWCMHISIVLLQCDVSRNISISISFYVTRNTIIEHKQWPKSDESICMCNRWGKKGDVD